VVLPFHEKWMERRLFLTGMRPMARLYQRLADFGYDRKYVRKIALPSWWDDAMADVPSGYAQTLTLLSRNLNLDLHSLQEDATPLQCRTYPAPRHKRRQGISDGDSRLAECMAIRAAQLACFAMSSPLHPIPKNSLAIRQAMLGTGASAVNFEALLGYCWDLGIPVLHVTQFPERARKMDALAAKLEDRPVIILARKSSFSAWLLFHLAHELGHIACGHLEGNGILVDEDVEAEARDGEEAEANGFALSLLTGKSEIRYHYGTRTTGPQLAQWARIVGEYSQVDPGFVALNHGRNTGNWGTANGALRLLEPKANTIG
jgi:hypothetical protein